MLSTDLNASMGAPSEGVLPWTKDVEAASFRMSLGVYGMMVEQHTAAGTSFVEGDWTMVQQAGYLGLLSAMGTYLNGSGDTGWNAVAGTGGASDKAILRPNTNQKGWLGDSTHRLERVYTEGLRGPGAADGGVMEIGAGSALGLEVVEDSVENSTTIRPRYDGSGDLGDYAHRFYRVYAGNVHTSAVYLGSPGVPGPKIYYGNAAPSGTPAVGSLYIQNLSGELHMYINGAWKQLAFTA